MTLLAAAAGGGGAAADHSVVTCFVWLSRNPEQRRRLAETPDLMPNAIEEFLRVFSPAQARSRTVMHDVELAGRLLKPGDRVLLCWVSGNLDETEFENPEEVDFDRANKRHMAFGLGPHRCIGSDVVRLEFRIVFEQILSRMPDFRVEEAGLRPSPAPAIVAGYEHVPFVFMPGKKVGGPPSPTDLSEAWSGNPYGGRAWLSADPGESTTYSACTPEARRSCASSGPRTVELSNGRRRGKLVYWRKRGVPPG